MPTPKTLDTSLNSDFVCWVRDYVDSLTDEGMRLKDFEDDCLKEIPPLERAAVLQKLKADGLVFVERVGAIEHAFRGKPPCRRFPPDRDDLIDLFLSEAAPYVRLLRQAVDAKHRKDDRAAATRVKQAAGNLVGFTRRRIRPGTSFEDLRRELWLTFSETVLAPAAEFDRGFGKDAPIPETAATWPKKGRLPNRMPTDERLVGLVERAGVMGITRRELRAAFGPNVSTARLNARIDALEIACRLRSTPMKLENSERMVRRYFAASTGLPHVRDDGVGVWGPL